MAGFLLHEYPICFQLLIIEYLNTFMLIYQGFFKPAYSKFENRMDNFNEYVVTTCSIMIIWFTDWITDEELKFQYGWYFCGTILLSVLFNMFVIILLSFKSIFLVLKRLFRRAKRKLSRCVRRLRGETVDSEEESTSSTESSVVSHDSSLDSARLRAKLQREAQRVLVAQMLREKLEQKS